MKLTVGLLAIQALCFVIWLVLSLVIVRQWRMRLGPQWPTIRAQVKAVAEWRADPETTGKARAWLVLTTIVLGIAGYFFYVGLE